MSKFKNVCASVKWKDLKDAKRIIKSYSLMLDVLIDL